MHSDVQNYFEAKRAQDPWTALQGSDDRLVAYIATHAPAQYREQAEAVLQVLPGNATEQQLRDAGREAGFGGTGEFDRFVAQARAAGVFGDTPQTGASAERAALETWARNVAPGYVRDNHIAELFRHVDAIVAAENGEDADSES